MRFFTKAMRRNLAATILLLTLGVQAWAYTDGYDLGRHCSSVNRGSDGMNSCCDGGCSDMHTVGSDGYNSCMKKCNSCFLDRNCGPKLDDPE